MFKILSSVILALGTAACIAQTSSAPTVTNWGNPVRDVQLAISLSNNTFSVGTKTTLKCWIKNSSVDEVGLVIWTESDNFYAVLTNNLGKVYELTKDPSKSSAIYHRQVGKPIKPGETAAYEISLPFAEAIKPGPYKLIVRRKVEMGGKWYELVSNVLEVQVK